MDRARAEEIQRIAAKNANGFVVWCSPVVTWPELQELADAMLAQIKHAEGVERAEAYLRSRGCLRCLCEAAPGADGQTWIGGVPHACGKAS
jgi:hypothetical protein